jgi:hypothetical protein
MDANLLVSLINVVIGGIVSGLIVTMFNFYLSRRRTEAEIRDMEARTELTELEIENLKAQLQEVRTRVVDRLRVDDNRTIVLKEEERTLPGVTRERYK